METRPSAVSRGVGQPRSQGLRRKTGDQHGDLPEATAEDAASLRGETSGSEAVGDTPALMDPIHLAQAPIAAPESTGSAATAGSAATPAAVAASAGLADKVEGAVIPNDVPGVFNYTRHELTVDSAPEPLDPRVQVRQVPAGQWAVIRYSGTWSQANYDEHLAQLKAALEQAGVTTQGEPVLARYNPPLTPWFLRRNEIWLALR